MRLIYDEFKSINLKMECDIDDYLLRTQMDDTLTSVNKHLRQFTMEKIHLLHKNVNWLFNDITVLNYNEIKDYKGKYTFIDPNRDV